MKESKTNGITKNAENENKCTIDLELPSIKSDDLSGQITLTENDIELVCKICEISWENYFSKPLPDYEGMQVYWEDKIQLFHKLNRTDQLEIINSAHISKITPKDIQEQEKTSNEDFSIFIHKIISFKKGKLLGCHGIAHSVRTAINAQIIHQEYVRNFKEYENISNSRVLICSLSASLLHDIGRCLGGDGSDIFGATSAYIAGLILTEVGGFSDDEINWIKEAIEIGGIDNKEVQNFSEEKCHFLNDRQLIASIMGDADSFEFERFNRCDIGYTSIKKLGIVTKDGKSPDEVLNSLKKNARALVNKVCEPGRQKKGSLNISNYAEFLREELRKLNKL